MVGSLSHGKPLDVGQVGIDQDQLPPWEQGPIDPRQWFAPELSGAPIELEIGSGKGTFLLQQAPSQLQTCFLGIEYAKAFWAYAADRVRRNGLSNVRLLHTEAGFFVRRYLADASLDRVHIYFPDPWPKKRHHKRRLIQQSFLKDLARVVKPGCQVRLATDHADYFAWMQEHFAKAQAWFELEPFEPPESAGQGELAGTNFERKYRREGRSFHGATLRRR